MSSCSMKRTEKASFGKKTQFLKLTNNDGDEEGDVGELRVQSFGKVEMAMFEIFLHSLVTQTVLFGYEQEEEHEEVEKNIDSL